MKHLVRVTACAFVLAGANFAFAQDLFVYPNDEQSKEQQEADEFNCYKWARDESGFDPMAAPTATEAPPPQEAKKGGVGRGAVRGAAVGAIIDGSDGAKTGAAVGGAMGGMRRADQNRRQAQSQQQWEQEQVQQYEQSRNSYNRAYAACLEARGYTVR
ncbi:MAG: hypothetical protein KJO33_05875 [Gammaproteobacteria bacterium]|nr:hypothetical protein [Gammaproteobacteria bacterium]NNK33303.1 hypothetical protein [Xanthomonadales bacterium]